MNLNNLIHLLKQEINEFNIDTNRTSYLFNMYGVLLFLNKSNRFINGTYISCIDIVNIHLDNNLRSKGIFKQLVRYIINDLKRSIYIENVSNTSFQTYLEENGWISTPTYQYIHNNEQTKEDLSIHKDYYYIHPSLD